MSNEEEQSIEAFLPKQQVTILMVKGPDLFYINFSDKNCLQKQTEIHLNLQDYYSIHRLKTSEWEKGDKCVVYDKNKTQYYRAVIIDIFKDMYTVRTLDTAVEITVELDFLGILEEQFADYPEFAVPCHLAGIKPAGDSKRWSMLANEFLQDIFTVHKDCYLAKVDNLGDKKTLPVIIWYLEFIPGGALEESRDVFHSVNKLLVDNGLAFKEELPNLLKLYDENKKKLNYLSESKSYNVASEKRKSVSEWDSIVEEEFNKCLIMENWLNPLPINKNTFEAFGTFVDDSGYIYFHEVEIDLVLKEMERNMKKIYDKKLPEPSNTIWKVGQICIVKYFINENWYRGKITQVENNSIKVQMVDYGNEEDCKHEDLRKDIIYADVPIFANKLKLHRVEPPHGKWITSHLDLLHVQVVEKKILVKIINGNSNPPSALVFVDGINLNDFIDGHLRKIYICDLNRECLPTSTWNDSNDVIIEDDSVIIEDDKDDNFICGKLIFESNAKNHSDESNSSIKEKIFSKDNASIKNITSVKDSTVKDNELIEKTSNTNHDLLENMKMDDSIKNNDKYLSEYQCSEMSIFGNTESKCCNSNDLTSYSVSPLPISEGEIIDAAIVNVLDYNKVIFEFITELNETADVFETMSEDIKENGSNQPVLMDIKLGQACICQYSEDKDWYRAKIIDLSMLKAGAVLVWFVDFANFEKVPRNTIRSIRPEWLIYPLYHYIGVLKDVILVEKNLRSQATREMENILSGEVRF